MINPAGRAAVARNDAALKRLADSEQRIVESPQSSEAWFDKAEALAELHRNEESLTAYDQTLQLAPRLPLALRGKAVVLRELAKLDDALGVIELALQIDPSVALSWRTKGAILRSFGRHEEALSCYEKGLSIDPTDTVLWCNKGNTLRDLHRVKEALASYAKAQSIALFGSQDPTLKNALAAYERLRADSNAGAHLIMRGRHEFEVDRTWSSAAPEPPAEPARERFVISVRSVDDLQRWLAAHGFALKKEISGSSTLTGPSPGDYEHIDHHRTSLWAESCRLGDWGASGEHEAWLILEPVCDRIELQASQRRAWGRLGDLLAGHSMNHLSPTLAKALAMEAVHGQRLKAKVGSKISNFNACAACGEALYADIYGGSSDHYRVTLEGRSNALILCSECGKQLQTETRQQTQP